MGHEVTRLIQRVLLSAALLAAALAAPAVATDTVPPEPPVDWPIYDIVFPVAGPHLYSDTWGEARSGGRTHEGTDIVADKGVPVVAAADGEVGWIGTTCCYIQIRHDGWETWYIHLNNDTPGTDDGLGWGIADGIEPGVRVVAGQLIGWVGDSGNAEDTDPHLHFEIRESGVAINSYPSLLVATEPPGYVPLNVGKNYFSDDDDSVHEPDIDRLAASGIARGCNPPLNTMFCPDRLITRGEIAAFIRRTLALPPTDVDYYVDDSSSVFQGDINALAAAGIALECEPDRYCPDRPLIRNEMAEMLVRAFAGDQPERYANPDAEDFFTDDDGDIYEDSINRLMAAGVTKGCNPPENDRFCPERPLIRAEMASFFWRALNG
ncbi:hypothetical protein BH23ACT5_BH23ACT5_01910 [soil metagenome]